MYRTLKIQYAKYLIPHSLQEFLDEILLLMAADEVGQWHALAMLVHS